MLVPPSEAVYVVVFAGMEGKCLERWELMRAAGKTTVLVRTNDWQDK